MKVKNYFIVALMLLISSCGQDEPAHKPKEDVQTFCIMKMDWNGGMPRQVLHKCVELDQLWRWQNKKEYDIFESVNCECD